MTTTLRALRLAHRGDTRHAPENTLEALAAALASTTCDGLEFDVRLARDRVPVVIHDESLQRVQGIGRRVDAVDAADLEAAGVPTLAAALALVVERRPTAFLDIELKGAEHGRRTADVLREGLGDAPEHAVVSSFEAAALETVRAWLPRWGRWLNADDVPGAAIDRAASLGCTGVSLEWHRIDDAAMAHAANAGLEVAAWTIRDRETARRMDALGVRAMCVEADALDGR